MRKQPLRSFALQVKSLDVRNADEDRSDYE
jgi:hypothetical protein